MLPEVYSEEEMKAVEEHIEMCFGAFETVLHEVVSPDIHVDVCAKSTCRWRTSRPTTTWTFICAGAWSIS